MSMMIYSLFFGLFIIIILFITFDNSLSDTMFPNTIAELNDTNTSFSIGVKSTVQVMQSVWLFVPLFALLGLIYFAFSKSQGGG